MYTNERTDAVPPASSEEMFTGETVTAPDRYGDVALGVECAWPVMMIID